MYLYNIMSRTWYTNTTILLTMNSTFACKLMISRTYINKTIVEGIIRLPVVVADLSIVTNKGCPKVHKQGL